MRSFPGEVSIAETMRPAVFSLQWRMPGNSGRLEHGLAVTPMLQNTFVHLPGVGPRRERALWEQGILDWNRLLATAEEGQRRRRIRESWLQLVRGSIDALARGDVGFFKPLLPSREAWRLYSEFAERALFLDIETTGLSGDYDEVTLIGALCNGELALFINGINLEQFPAYIERFPLLVTFNGSQFDVPFLRAHFPHARLDQAHIDLRFVLASLGYKGGLKVVESGLGLHRDPAIQGVDRFEAVRLWHRYRRGDKKALEKLILYNLTDVANLVELAETGVGQKSRRLAFPGQAVVHDASRAPRLDSVHVAGWTSRYMAATIA
jgi:uncharacterized protein YprB with RNaseH-like and TPR domain